MSPPASSPRPERLPGFIAHPAFRYGLCILGAVIGGMLLFQLVGMPVFARIGVPHEYCYLREPRLVWLHVITDFLIGAAYLSISCTLAYLVWRSSRNIPLNWVFLAFGLFIITCGFTHFMEVVVIWHPMYWLSGYIKAVTAAASVATAIVIIPLVPRVLRMISDARESEQRRLEVEQLNQDLERFNYSVAHDLRAPLRGLSAFAQILIEDHGKELSPEARAHLDRMQASVTRMDALITDLLKYATIGRQELRLGTVSLDEVLRTVRSLMEVEIAERKAEVVAPEPLPLVLGDALLLQVVFQNLIGNGIKFVPPGTAPRVEISAERDEDHVTILFTDNGTGIPDMARERIFRLFERLHSRHPGTGIGLAITQRAVERLQGRIGVEGVEGASGSRFWVRLRAAPGPAASSAAEKRVG